MLSDAKIEELAKEKKLITPFYKDALQSASHDLRLSNKILVGPIPIEGKKGVTIDLRKVKNRTYKIKPGQFVSAMSEETLTLPKDICGKFGVRSKYTRKGLMVFGGPQLDPGWRGKLIVSLFNVGPEPLPLKLGERFFTVEFHRLEGVSEGYRGPYQDQFDFPGKDRNFIVRAGTSGIVEAAPIQKNMKILEKQIDSLGRIKISSLVVQPPPWVLAILPFLTGFFLCLTLAEFYLGDVALALGLLGIAITGLLGSLALFKPAIKRKLRLK